MYACARVRLCLCLFVVYLCVHAHVLTLLTCSLLERRPDASCIRSRALASAADAISSGQRLVSPFASACRHVLRACVQCVCLSCCCVQDDTLPSLTHVCSCHVEMPGCCVHAGVDETDQIRVTQPRGISPTQTGTVTDTSTTLHLLAAAVCASLGAFSPLLL